MDRGLIEAKNIQKPFKSNVKKREIDGTHVKCEGPTQKSCFGDNERIGKANMH